MLAFNHKSGCLNWFQVVTLRHRLITVAQETDVVTKVCAYSSLRAVFADLYIPR